MMAHGTFPIVRSLVCGAMALAIGAELRAADANFPNVAAQSGKPVVVGVKIEPADEVRWAGVVEFDDAGVGQNSMLYGPGPVGFVAALIAHATTVHFSKQSQKSRLQEEADKVLEPLQAELAQQRVQALTSQAVVHLSERAASTQWAQAAGGDGGWEVASSPTFAMTQDRSAIVLYNELLVRGPAPIAAVSTVRVRVVAPAISGRDDLIGFWRANDGEALKSRSAELLARSIQIAWEQAGPSARQVAAAPQKTYRYLEGAKRKAERGELMAERCGAVLIRTLRQDFLEMPVPQDGPACATAQAPADAR